MQRKGGIVNRYLLLSSLALLGGAFAANAPSATATEVSFESRTYLPARGTEGEKTHVLLYEYLSLDAEDVFKPGLYLRVGGWGRTDLADETFDRRTNGELQYAFLGWRGPYRNAEARVGRVSLTAGVARNEVFDGLMIGSDLPGGFDVTIFGGIPIEVDERSRTEDSLYGARVSQGLAGIYRLGGSYIKERDAGNDAREEVGSDLFLCPLPLLQVTGTSLYNVIDEEWARHDYRIGLGPFLQRIRFTATWASTDYRHFFQSPLNRAFSPAREEQLDRIGGEIEIALGLGFKLAGEGATYRYDLSGDAKSYGAGLEWAGARVTAGAGYRQVQGDAEENRYREYRAYATAGLRAVRLAAGAEHQAYEEAINGEKDATTGTLSLGYAVNQAFELTLSGQYGVTPEYEREVKGLLAVLWRYDVSAKKGGSK